MMRYDVNAMDHRAETIVHEYIEQLYHAKNISEFSVFIVWKSKVLQNRKYMIGSTLFDNTYYELTYNGDKKEWYLDAYKKFENKVIKEDAL